MSDSSFYKGEKKKLKKRDLEKKVQKHLTTAFVLPEIEIIGKGKKKR